jgi:putative spermidine/putrescine transport system ATP-binding protein
MTVSLTLDRVQVTLGATRVLRGVCLDVADGEFVTLLGASGSGKSTLLNVIAGLQRIDSGRVLFDGVDVGRRPPQKRNVGVVFQSYALFPHLTVAENVAFPLAMARRGRAERAEVVDRMLRLVQLADLGPRSPASLSGGQRQRVALARALAANPGILLLDEPLAALDKQLRELMQVEIKRIQQKVGITTVAVTHDQAEALTMSDRVAIVHEGTIVQVDSPQELYRRPVNEYVARFLGEANLLPVRGDGLSAAGTGESAEGSGEPTGTAVIRPEDLELADPSGPAGRWSVDGTVSMVSFQGARFRVEVEPPGGATVVASVHSGWSGPGLVPGSPARLTVRDPDRVHVITADPVADPPRGASELAETGGSGR